MKKSRLKFWRYIVLTPVLGAFGLGVLWALGLASFVMTITLIPPQYPGLRTDGIVVLTGGADRVRTGLELLKEGAAKELLISGVHKTADLRDLLTMAQMPDSTLPCCITLGFQAVDTVGNAAETASWVHDHNIKTLRLVTASYHIPRATIELRRALPNVKIIMQPVHTKRFDLWTRNGFILVLSEYHKTMVAAVRLFGTHVRNTLELG